jgi:transglycosylase-like protein with SLT domain
MPMGQPSRGAFTVLATFLVLAISFDSSPTRPSPPSPEPPNRRPPDPREIALVDELTGHAGRGSELRVMRREDLDAALSLAPQPHSSLWGGAPSGAESEVVKKLPFGRAIVRAAERHRVDPLLLAAMVEMESGFAPDAVSSEGAIGLLQLIPETGELYGKTDLFDPYVNLEVGSQYIGAITATWRSPWRPTTADRRP